MITAMQAWAISVTQKSDLYKKIEQQIVNAAKRGKNEVTIRLYGECENITDAQRDENEAIITDLYRLGYNIGLNDDPGLLIIRFRDNIKYSEVTKNEEETRENI